MSRGRILLAGTVASAASLLPRRSDARDSRLQTPLLRLLGIELPLLQAPMSGVVTPALVAAVSNAGGLGILPGIMLRNEFTEGWAASGAPVLPAVVQQLAALDVIAASAAKGSGSFYPMYAGQGCGAVRDLPTVASLIQRTIQEPGARLRRHLRLPDEGAAALGRGPSCVAEEGPHHEAYRDTISSV